MRPTSFIRPLLLSIVVVLLATPLLHAQAQIKVGDISLKFGLLAQGWADSAQNAAPAVGYANNLFLRRIRFLVGGQINPNLSFFFDTDNPNDGKAPKNLGAGFITQDAFVEWKPTGNNAFILDAGLMLPPLCRNCLESAATILSLDYGTFSFTESGPTQSVVGRDTGFLAKGYLAGGKFEYRGGIFQGARQTGSRNSLRETARLSYNPWETESGYTYPGVYLGNKKVLQFGGGIDHQADYKGYSADAFISLPIGVAPATTPPPATPVSRDAVNAELTLLAFDGGTTFATGATAIPEQKAATMQLGYYISQFKIMPWGRLEKQDFRASANNGRDNNRQQVGLTWFPGGNNFNVKAAYSRVSPRVGTTTNEYTVQVQFFYY